MATYSHLGHQQIDSCGFRAHAINTDTDVRFATDGTHPPRGLYFSFSLHRSLSLFCACVAPGYASTRQPRLASPCLSSPHTTVPYKNMITWMFPYEIRTRMYFFQMWSLLYCISYWPSYSFIANPNQLLPLCLTKYLAMKMRWGVEISPQALLIPVSIE
jgi:hypothetical protein